MKRILVIAVLLGFASSAFAQDASKAWSTIVSRCARSNLIGKESLFFGVSNLIGPGSIWRRANDGSIRLIMVLSDAVPKDSDQASIVKANNVGSCIGNSTTGWNIKLGLPFSTGATSLSIDIGAVLGEAHRVTVSIQGFAVDALDEDNWKKAFAALGPDNIYFKDTLEPNRMLAENAVKVTGFKAVFDYSHDLSADVQAKFKGKSFTLGNSSTGGSGGSKSNGAASSTGKAGGANQPTGGTSSSAASATSDKPTSAATQNNTSGTCSPSAPSTSGGTSNSESPTSADSSGVATLHVDFSSRRQLTICADGPFYILAAYSNLTNGIPLGIAPTQGSLQDNIKIGPDVKLQSNAVAGSDRQAAKPN
jgi:hypothetical protein